MKAKLISYRFDLTIPEEAAAYKALSTSLKKTNGEGVCTWGGKCSHYLTFAKDGVDVELETEHLFSDQWNTAPIDGISDNGLRVFDWAEDYLIDFRKTLKRGHYLVITDEMREIRRNTHECGYCGAQEPAQKGYVFCPHCLSSGSLTKDQLFILRMKSVDDKSNRAPLSDAESAHLIPLWKDAQIFGNTERAKARTAKMRQQIETDYKKAVSEAETEYKGFSWLMDQGLSVDNVIYYSHTNTFCFGWRQPIDAELLSTILDVISEFPFRYGIKCADGRTLAN